MKTAGKGLLPILLAAAFFPLKGQSWIRINQLGYLPNTIKVGVLVSKDDIQPDHFTLRSALTDEILFTSRKIAGYGPYGAFASTFRLDFTDYNHPGSVYLEADGAVSPVFCISQKTYAGTADFLLHYMRQQRCGYNPFLRDSCHTQDGYIIYHPDKDSVHIDVTGGWHDATDYLQYTATSANAVYQMLLAYRQHPAAFGDAFQANGEPGRNGIPDILDEARWGLDWLIKMNPDSGQLFNQIADDRDHAGFRLPTEDRVSYGKGLERPVYFCHGGIQGLFEHKNRTTGLASTAGKFASAFAMGSAVWRSIDPRFSDLLRTKAMDAWSVGVAHPGACQTAPCRAPYFYEEDNWVDDMELAGAELYAITAEKAYLDAAAAYGRQEITTPWMGADTARHYQWYPFLNMGHWAIGQSGDAAYSLEFLEYWRTGLENVREKGSKNPFLNGVPGIWCSNNLTVALITQCHLYAEATGDDRFREMEAALRDWLFGCNPWGTGMVIGLPAYGDFPADPHSSLSVLHGFRLNGGLVDGPVYYSIFRNLKGISLAGEDEYEAFQSNLTVYHDDYADYSTNEPTMDGTADFTYYLSAMQAEAQDHTPADHELILDHGAIVRGDTRQPRISLVFTGHDRAEGFGTVRKALQTYGIKASFFLTGDFYRNTSFTRMIRTLQREGHYLGGHSGKHLLYCSWDNRDSLLVNKQTFVEDLKDNYASMAAFGIGPEQAPFFLPPYEWYNDSVAAWCQQYGLQLVNFTPGTGSNQDWTYPEQGPRYVSSDSIFSRILSYEEKDPNGMNGFILLTHFGTDPRRPDKFYKRLDALIRELKERGYAFVPIRELLTQ